MAETKIVVIGAGVSGLTTALLLSRNTDYKVTIIAKFMPGDMDIEYASPWAGANFLPLLSTSGQLTQPNGSSKYPAHFYERDTWPELSQLARDQPSAGVHFQENIQYIREKDKDGPMAGWIKALKTKDSWIQKMLTGWRDLPKSELPPGMSAGLAFTSVCINTALYLPWLTSECLRNGVKLKRGVLNHVSEAADLHYSGQRADVVINCTGLGARLLGGVDDNTMFPVRGQTVLVRNVPAGKMVGTSGTGEPDEATYIMDRAAGGGCILGGCMQPNEWNREPDPNLAVRIMKRTVEICPSLVKKGQGIEGLSVIRHNVGLRPAREGGIRIEKETIKTADGRPLIVVHNYGHAGYGYQTSYGCSKATKKLVDDALKSRARL